MYLPTVIGLTGGIATGKTTCCEILRELQPDTVVFDADRCVRELYTRPEVISALVGHFGDGMLDSRGGADKAFLRARAFLRTDLTSASQPTYW